MMGYQAELQQMSDSCCRCSPIHRLHQYEHYMMVEQTIYIIVIRIILILYQIDKWLLTIGKISELLSGDTFKKILFEANI
jgi:hypothetical protein